MNNPAVSQYSAADSSLGYLYQVRLSLLWALRRLKTGSDFLIGVETLDDVAFETLNNNPTDLLQTKHHRTGTGDLTDASPDIWKTLRIWFEGHASGLIPKSANLYLITTGNAPDGTAASYLRTFNRNVTAAQQALDIISLSSTNERNLAGYSAYRAVSASKQIAILNKVFVIDASPSVINLDDELRTEVYWAAKREHQTAFLERLEGWWFRRVLKQLTSTSAERIGSIELDSQMSDLREQFKQESLPIDEEILLFTLDEETEVVYENYTFVRQLELIKVGKRRIANAIRDYYRAFEQRSRWLRDDLIVSMDLYKYEQRLVEEWDIIFTAMCDEVGVEATNEAREQSARQILAWAETTSLHIRPNVTEPFVSRGSFHMLSDEMRIGWHPEFKEVLEPLLRGSAEDIR